jgi:polysaccharide deacetylase family protein (PEP-CTERM system associated)
MKVAVLSMDVEDWHHLEYFRRYSCDRSVSLLDGVEVYRELLAMEGIPSSFFILGELAAAHAPLLRKLAEEGHDLGVHGWDHKRPLTMTPGEFADDLDRAKKELENAVGQAAAGYRAPCFSLDRPRLEMVRQAGFAYDSSRIDFGIHPLYGTLDMQGFAMADPCIYRLEDFFEFQVSTLSWGRKQLPVSGGGYLRIFPWMIMRRLIQTYLKTESLYVLYIHPFELSRKSPPLPPGMPWRNRFRFGRGRSSTAGKLKALIALLKQHGYRFATFASLRRELSVPDR